MPEDRQKCLDAGAQDYVSKPIDVDQLIAAIEKLP
jgi:CheY-like chemotaxis protein